jgi:hypothetical protein
LELYDLDLFDKTFFFKTSHHAKLRTGSAYLSYLTHNIWTLRIAVLCNSYHDETFFIDYFLC